MATETKNEISVSQKPQAKGPELPATPLFGPLEEVERLFDRLMPATWMRPAAWRWPLWSGLEDIESIRTPQLNVIDHDKEIVLRAEMPGVEKKDIQVSLTNNLLNIRGTVARESQEQKQNYVRCEISRGVFSRNFVIPDGIDSTGISASLKDGILEVVLPKEEGTQRRAVEVK